MTVTLSAAVGLKYGTEVRLRRAVLPTGTLTIAGFPVPVDRIWLTGFVVVVGSALAIWFGRSRTGIAIQAAAEDERAASFARLSPLGARHGHLGARHGVRQLRHDRRRPGIGVVTPGNLTLLVVPALAVALIARLESLWIALVAAFGPRRAAVRAGVPVEHQGLVAGVGQGGTDRRRAVRRHRHHPLRLGRSIPVRGEDIRSRLPPVILPRNRPLVIAAAVAAALVALGADVGQLPLRRHHEPRGLADRAVAGAVSLAWSGQISLAQTAFAGVAGLVLSKFGTGVPFPLSLLLAAGVAGCRRRHRGSAGVAHPRRATGDRHAGGGGRRRALRLRQPAGRVGWYQPHSRPEAVRPQPVGARRTRRRPSVVRRLRARRRGDRLRPRRQHHAGRQRPQDAGGSLQRAGGGVDRHRRADHQARVPSPSRRSSPDWAGRSSATAGGSCRRSRSACSSASASSPSPISAASRAPAARSSPARWRRSGSSTSSFDRALSVAAYYALVSGPLLILTVIFNPVGIAGRVRVVLGPAATRTAPRAGADQCRCRQPAPAIAAAPPRRPDCASIGDVLLRPSEITVDLRRAAGSRSGSSLEVRAGEIVGLIGPNGAGKTSFIDAVTGFTPCSGQVYLLGAAARRHARRRPSPQGAGAHVAVRRAVRRPLGRGQRAGRPTTVGHDGWKMLRDCGAAERASVACGRAMRSRWSVSSRWPTASRASCRSATRSSSVWPDPSPCDPKVLLLDEPAAGLDIAEIAAFGGASPRSPPPESAACSSTTTCASCSTCATASYVIDFGVLIASGRPDEVRRDPAVIAAYLGSLQVDAGVSTPTD